MTAVVVTAAPDARGEDLVAALGLPAPRGTVVVNGTAGALDAGLAERLSDLLGDDGLAGLARRDGLTLVTGGTDAGIFSILGRAMVGSPACLVGVAPRSLVTLLGHPDGHRVPLEPNHTHYVLVDGDAWGDETPALLALAGALHRLAPAVAVVVGGGPVTCKEALGHVRAGRPLVVVAGSGRIADELADAAAGGRAATGADIREIVAGGHITVCPVSAGGPGLIDAVIAALRLV